jgi:hypothetical protein
MFLVPLEILELRTTLLLNTPIWKDKMQLNMATTYAIKVSSCMRKTKSTTDKAAEEPLPKWAEDEIKNVQFDQPETLIRTGYILDMYQEQSKIDIQLYEALQDGRTIIEGLDIPKSISMSDFMKGVVYEFKIKMFKGNLSTQLIELLKSKFSLQMEAIYRFELEEIQLMDVESDIAATPMPSDRENGAEGED